MDLNSVFYLRKNVGERTIPLIPAKNSAGEFILFLTDKGKVHSVKALPIETVYLAKEIDHENDFYLEYLNTLYQKGPLNLIKKRLESIKNDLLNMFAIFGKLELYQKMKLNTSSSVIRFINTDIEYIFYVLRSIYDLNYNVIRTIWENVELNSGLKRLELPKKFSSLIAKENHNYGLGNNYKSYLKSEYEFFDNIRNVRNAFDHHGKESNLIFELDGEFAFRKDSDFFQSFNDLWTKDKMANHDLVPLIPVLKLIIQRFLAGLNNSIQSFELDIYLNEEMAPGYKVFIKSEYVNFFKEK